MMQVLEFPSLFQAAPKGALKHYICFYCQKPPTTNLAPQTGVG